MTYRSHRSALAESRDFNVYTIRLPRELSEAIRAAADRAFEPQSVLVRRLVARGLEAETAGGAK